MAKATFVSRLQNIEISGQLYKGVDLLQGVHVANDAQKKKGWLDETFRNWVGKLEADYLRDSPAYLYAVSEITFEKSADLNTLNSFLGISQLALTGLWLVKDNAINLDTGFLIIDVPSPPYTLVTSDVWAARYTDASGALFETSFDRKELRDAATLLLSWAQASGQHDSATEPNLFTNVARLQRVLFFVQAARAQDRLPLKIIHYCTCFETLFTTDSMEVSHKIAERVARFLGTNHEERVDVFEQMKDIYDIRSSVVHGELLRTKFRDNIEPYSVACDTFLRLTITKILQDSTLSETFSGNQEQLNEFFKQLVLA